MPGERKITITIQESADPAGFLGRLAYDDAFRAKLADPGLVEEALGQFGISVEETENDELLPPEITLPARRKVQRVIGAIHYPKNPPPFGMCKGWAVTAYAAGAAEEEDGGQTS